jgi:hypothetical protein
MELELPSVQWHPRLASKYLKRVKASVDSKNLNLEPNQEPNPDPMIPPDKYSQEILLNR